MPNPWDLDWSAGYPAQDAIPLRIVPFFGRPRAPMLDEAGYPTSVRSPSRASAPSVQSAFRPAWNDGSSSSTEPDTQTLASSSVVDQLQQSGDPRLSGLNATVGQMLQAGVPIGRIAKTIANAGIPIRQVAQSLLEAEAFRRLNPTYQGDWTVQLDRSSPPHSFQQPPAASYPTQGPQNSGDAGSYVPAVFTHGAGRSASSLDDSGSSPDLFVEAAAPQAIPNLPRDSAACTNKGRQALADPRKGPFIRAHAKDAAAVGQSIATQTANVLGLSALESGWGDEKQNFPRNKNFFGQHSGQPGQIGSFATAGDGRGAIFPDYLASARSFAQQYGPIVRGVVDPLEFAKRLQNSGAFGILPDGKKVKGYPRTTAATIRGIEEALKCLR